MCGSHPAGNMERNRRVVHVLCFMELVGHFSEEFLGNFSQGGCSLGYMVLGTCGCAVLWCNPSDAQLECLEGMHV